MKSLAGIYAALCGERMDGQSARHGQMCEEGFSIEGGITQGIKLAMRVCVCVCVCVCVYVL